MNYNEKYELIDLSEEIYHQGMPVFGMPENLYYMTNQIMRKNSKQTGSKTLSSVRNLLIRGMDLHIQMPYGSTIQKVNHRWMDI